MWVWITSCSVYTLRMRQRKKKRQKSNSNLRLPLHGSRFNRLCYEDIVTGIALNYLLEYVRGCFCFSVLANKQRSSSQLCENDFCVHWSRIVSQVTRKKSLKSERKSKPQGVGPVASTLPVGHDSTKCEALKISIFKPDTKVPSNPTMGRNCLVRNHNKAEKPSIVQ